MIYCFDIDSTILFSEVNQQGDYYIKSVNFKLVEIINDLYQKGNTIIIYTARHWNHLLDTEKQLIAIKIKYNCLLMGKPYADFYIDDKSVIPENFIKEFKND